MSRLVSILKAVAGGKRAFLRTRLSATRQGYLDYVGGGLCAIGAVAVSIWVLPGPPGMLGAALAVVMIAIAIVDLRHFIIPNTLVVTGLGLGLCYVLISQPESAPVALLRGLVAAFAFWALRAAYLRIRGEEGIGLGDVKLAAVAGLWLDWLGISVAVELAALVALAAVAVQALRGRQITGKTPVPFGFFFAPAIWVSWLLEAMLLSSKL